MFVGAVVEFGVAARGVKVGNAGASVPYVGVAFAQLAASESKMVCPPSARIWRRENSLLFTFYLYLDPMPRVVHVTFEIPYMPRVFGLRV